MGQGFYLKGSRWVVTSPYLLDKFQDYSMDCVKGLPLVCGCNIMLVVVDCLTIYDWFLALWGPIIPYGRGSSNPVVNEAGECPIPRTLYLYLLHLPKQKPMLRQSKYQNQCTLLNIWVINDHCITLTSKCNTYTSQMGHRDERPLCT